jgi:hypothetical protein
MIADSTLIAHAKAAFEALDVSPENERIADIEAAQAKIEAAISRAQARHSEIGRLLSAWAPPAPGGAVADALLAEVDPELAAAEAPTDDRLREERVALDQGIRELRRRLDDCEAEKGQVRHAAAAKAARAGAPLMEAMIADMHQTAQRLVTSYAALVAVAEASYSQRPDGARAAMEGIMGAGKLLDWRKTIDVPSEIHAALQPLNGKGKALPSRVISQVAAP